MVARRVMGYLLWALAGRLFVPAALIAGVFGILAPVAAVTLGRRAMAVAEGHRAGGRHDGLRVHDDRWKFKPQRSWSCRLH